MTKRRYTIETLAAGQPRPYADTIYCYRITFEWQGMAGFKDKDAPFVPWNADEEVARKFAYQFGPWTKEDEGDWASTRLEYIKKVEQHVWEWQTTAAFTD